MRGNTESGNVDSSHSSAWGASSFVTKAWIDSRRRSCSSVKMKCRCEAAKSGLSTSVAGVPMKVDSRTSHFRWQPRPGTLVYRFFGGSRRIVCLTAIIAPAASLPLIATVTFLPRLVFFSALKADFFSFTFTVAVLPAAIVNAFEPSTFLPRLSLTLPLHQLPASPVQLTRRRTLPLRLTRRRLPTLSLAVACLALADGEL